MPHPRYRDVRPNVLVLPGLVDKLCEKEESVGRAHAVSEEDDTPLAVGFVGCFN